jgi:hypothetical protein
MCMHSVLLNTVAACFGLVIWPFSVPLVLKCKDLANVQCIIQGVPFTRFKTNSKGRELAL